MDLSIENILTYNEEYSFANILALLFMVVVALLSIFVIKNKTKDNRIAFLFFICLNYRIVLSSAYYYVTKSYPDADTLDFYWFAAKSTSIDGLYGHGFKFIGLTLYPFINIFKLTYFSCFMLNCLYGFFGMAFLVLALVEQLPGLNRGRWYVAMLLFWPGLNLWTSMIGKDSLIFLGLGMLFYALSTLKKRILLVVASIVLVAHIRPYIAMIIVLCLILSLMISSGGLSWKKKALILCLLLIAIVPISSAFLKMFGLESMDIATAGEILERRQSHWGGGSSIDISNTFILVKILMYLFRPFFFDAHSVPMLLASIENLVLIVVTFRLLRPNFIIFLIKTKSLIIKFCAVYFVVAITLLASSTSNLGTASRQKNMVVFTLIMLNGIYYLYSKIRNNALHRQIKNSRAMLNY